MISLHIFWFINCVVAFLVALKLRISFIRSGGENLKDFYRIFVFTGLFFLLTSLQGLIQEDGFLAQVGFIASWAAIFPAAFFGLHIVSDIWNLPRVKKACFPVAIVMVAAFLILAILDFSPATIVYFGNYWYWTEGTPLWLQVLAGGLVGLVILTIGLFFVISGFRTKNKRVSNRSFLIGGGFILMFLGNIAAYILFTLSPAFVLLAAVLTVSGLLMLYSGIQYKVQKD